jgi:hypothetical protein
VEEVTASATEWPILNHKLEEEIRRNRMKDAEIADLRRSVAELRELLLKR